MGGGEGGVQPTVKIAAKIVIAINHFEDRSLKKTGRVAPITYYFNFPLIGSFRRRRPSLRI